LRRFGGIFLFEVIFVIIAILSLLYLRRIRRKWREPESLELSLLVLIVLSATFLPQTGIVLLKSVMGFDLRDFMFFILLFLVVGKAIEGKRPFVLTNLGKLLVVFYGATVVSVIVARVHSVWIHRTFNELRPLAYLGLALLIPNVLRRKGQIFLFLHFLLFYAILTAGIDLFEELARVRVAFFRHFYRELTFSGIFIFAYLSTVRTIPKVWRGLFLVVPLLDIIILFLSGGRHYYLGLMGSLPVFFLSLFLRGRLLSLTKRLVPVLLIGLLIILAVYQVSTPYRERVNRNIARLKSIFDPRTYENPLKTGGPRTAVGRRMMDKDFAMRWVKKWPIYGTGLGFKFWDWRYRGAYRDGQYLDNGWLWMLMKMGIIGLAPFLIMSLAYIFKGVLLFKRLRSPILQGVILGFACQYLFLCLDALTRAGFFTPGGGATWGVLIGTSEAIFNAFPHSRGGSGTYIKNKPQLHGDRPSLKPSLVKGMPIRRKERIR